MKKYKKVISIILAIAGTAAFGQFIIEESIQNYGFGVSMLIMNKMYQSSIKNAEYVKEQLDNYQAFHNNSQLIMGILYLGNPITAVWFHQYMVSDNKKISYYKKLVSEELFYLKTKQAKREKKARDKYLAKKDKEHIDGILKINDPY